MNRIRIAKDDLAQVTHEAQRGYDLTLGMLGASMKRLILLFGLVVVVLAMATPASAQPQTSACSLQGLYVGTITVLKPSLVSGIGKFTFTPAFIPPPGSPIPCPADGTVSLESSLGSVQGMQYFVSGNDLSFFLNVSGTALNFTGLIAQGPPGTVAEGFVYKATGFAGQVVDFGGTALKAVLFAP